LTLTQPPRQTNTRTGCRRRGRGEEIPQARGAEAAVGARLADRLHQPARALAAEVHEPDPDAVGFRGRHRLSDDPELHGLEAEAARVGVVGDDAVGIRRPREGAVHGEGDPVARFFQKRLDEVTLQHDVAERDERARAEITLGQGERIGLARRGEVGIVHEAGAGNVDGLRAVAADNHRVPAAERGEVVEAPRQDGPALHPEHGLRHPRGEAAEVRAFARGEDHRGERFTRGQIAALRLRQLRVTLQAKDLVERGHLRLHGEQRIIRPKPARRLLHGADGRPQQMVRPDHHADLPRAEILGRGAPVRGRHEHRGQAIAPLREEGEDLGRARLLRVDENGSAHAE
jgi:hypothetical protein